MSTYLVHDAGADVDRGEGRGLHDRAELRDRHEVGHGVSDSSGRQVGHAVGDSRSLGLENGFGLLWMREQPCRDGV